MVLGGITRFARSVFGKTKVRNGLMGVVAVSLLLQLYFVRELLAAELFFGIGFPALLALGGVLYVAVSVSELCLNYTWSFLVCCAKTRVAQAAGSLNVRRKDWIAAESGGPACHVKPMSSIRRQPGDCSWL